MSPFTWEERGSIWGSECLVPSLGGVFEFEPHGFSEDFGFGLIQFTSGTSWLQSFPCSSQIGSRMNLALFNCLWYEALSSVPCVAAQFRYHAKCVLSCFSRVRLFVTPLWLHAPLSMGFSRQEYWGGLPCPPPGSLPYPGIEPMSLMSSALAGGFFTTSTTWEAQFRYQNDPNAIVLERVAVIQAVQIEKEMKCEKDGTKRGQTLIFLLTVIYKQDTKES